MMDFGAVTVTDVVTQIMTPNNSRRAYVIANNGSQTMYLGFSSTITSSTGIPLLPGEKFENGGYQDAWASDIYGICATGLSVDCRYLSWGVR